MRAILLMPALLLCLSCAPAAELGWNVEQNGAIRWRKLSVPPGKSGFTLLDGISAGFRFTNLVDELSSARNRTLENGAGVAGGDYNGDTLPDIFICGLLGGSALFQNRGEWQFSDATANSGLPSNIPARGAVFADVNGDARDDLLVVTLAEGVRCFTNSGNATFAELLTAGMRTNLGVATLALADIDRNGTLDVYATTYRADDIRDRARIDIQRVGGKVEVAPALRGRIFLTKGGLFEVGEPDVLYLNDGSGHFKPAPQRLRASLQNSSASFNDWGLAASFRDWTGDGWPDLYVCNDYWTPDRIFKNAGAGELRLVEPEALPHASENSMGVDFADINGDGFLDIFVTDMLSREHARRHSQAVAQAVVPAELRAGGDRPHYMQNMLFLNRGDGTFAEIAEFSGVSASEWSWQPVFMDIDLDGYPDLLIPAGHTRDLQDLDATDNIRRLQHAWPANLPADEMQRAFTRELMEHARLYPRFDAPIVAFRNNGNLKFTDMTEHWGTSNTRVHQGIAVADLDADGDLDFVVNNLNNAATLYRNDSATARFSVRLRGRAPNTAAAGAKVRVRCHGLPDQRAEVSVGGRYLSGFDTQLMFAAGREDAQVDLLISWPTGNETEISVRANRAYEIEEPRGRE